jgi:ABC-type sugar transport system permease subunit
MGYAAALSFVLFGLILVVSLFSMRAVRGEVAYQ